MCHIDSDNCYIDTECVQLEYIASTEFIERFSPLTTHSLLLGSRNCCGLQSFLRKVDRQEGMEMVKEELSECMSGAEQEVSFTCELCGDKFAKSRRVAHEMYWCPERNSMSDDDDNDKSDDEVITTVLSNQINKNNHKDDDKIVNKDLYNNGIPQQWSTGLVEVELLSSSNSPLCLTFAKQNIFGELSTGIT